MGDNFLVGPESLVDFISGFNDGNESIPSITYRVSEGASVDFYLSVVAADVPSGGGAERNSSICIEWDYPQHRSQVEIGVAAKVMMAVSNAYQGLAHIVIPTSANRMDNFDFKAITRDHIHSLCVFVEDIFKKNDLTENKTEKTLSQ